MTTVLAFHAHPDDEVLLTGGTLARAAAEGNRVVIVVATDGLMDAAPAGETPRLAELRAAAAALGVQRVVHPGYADSGHGAILYPYPPDRARFVRADTEEATMPRDGVARLVKLVRLLRIPLRFDPDAVRTCYTPRAAVTHTVDVRRFAARKQAALAAHRSQVSGTGRLAAVMRVPVRLPVPVFGRLLGREWFVEARAATSYDAVAGLFRPTS
ncbi:PIG-L family deacetylase [Streptomyces sp. NPDC007205]|uniref:PIG-L deacetylase family protein n=1 Tax=Streptomyces sp. NPDC007205 TaxID=3154316 RepID=UPI003408845F